MCRFIRQSSSARRGCGCWPVNGAIGASGSRRRCASRRASCVSAVQALPAIEYGREALRWSGTPEPQRWGDRIPYSVHAEYSLGTRAIPGMLVPGLALHANSYIGSVALGLALVAVWFRRGRLFAFIAVFAFLLALGKDTPVHWLAYRFIPLVEKARYPAMAIVLSQVGIAALVAQALSLPKDLLRRAALPFAIFGVAGLATLLRDRPPSRTPGVGSRRRRAGPRGSPAMGPCLTCRGARAIPRGSAIYPPPIIRPREFPGLTPV